MRTRKKPLAGPIPYAGGVRDIGMVEAGLHAAKEQDSYACTAPAWAARGAAWRAESLPERRQGIRDSAGWTALCLLQTAVSKCSEAPQLREGRKG